MNGDAALESMPDAAPAAWNADARSRAQTRALLMALSRQQALLVTRRPWVMALLAVPTFGILPLLLLARMMSRWHRLEWTLLGEFGRWVGTYRDAPAGKKLASKADAIRRKPLFGLHPVVVASAAMPLLIGATYATVNEFWFATQVLVSLAYLANHIAYCLTLSRTMSQYRAVRAWSREANWFLTAAGLRPIRVPERDQGSFAGIAVMALSIAAIAHLPLGAFAATCLAGIGFHEWNQRIADVRVVHLQLIERLLEWMDDTGLPVEYDVVALNPDEIAAMIA